jgi:hypothetical protein
MQFWPEKELELSRRPTLLPPQTLDLKVQDSRHQRQSALKQKAQHEQQVPATHALGLLTAAAFERGGCQMRGRRPSRHSPP